MEIRPLGNVFLGVAFGFMLGIVLYQASRVDIGFPGGQFTADTGAADPCSSEGSEGTCEVECADPATGVTICCPAGNSCNADGSCFSPPPPTTPPPPTCEVECADPATGVTICCPAGNSCNADGSCFSPPPSSSGPTCAPDGAFCTFPYNGTCCTQGYVCNPGCEAPSPSSSACPVTGDCVLDCLCETDGGFSYCDYECNGPPATSTATE